MSTLNPFTPGGSTVKVTANATPTSASGTIGAGTGNNIRVMNTGSVLVYVKLNGTTATAADIPMLPTSEKVFMFAGTSVAALSSTTTACDVYFTQGEGT